MENKIICLILSLTLLLFPLVIFADTNIQGEPSATQEQCVQWMKDRDIEEEFIDLIPYIYEECEKANIDPVLVIAQSALETSNFTSYIFRKYHNTAGIKKRSNTNEYQFYDTYKEGFKAQINHLALYSGNPQEDYYYSKGLDGWCTTIEQLSGRWAEDRKYSTKILSIMKQIQSYEVAQKEENNKKDKNETKEKSETKEKIIKKSKSKSPTNIINDILKKNKKHSIGFYKIFDYLK